MVQFGLSSTPSQYRRLIQRFVKSYLGDADKPVPFGGRQTQLAQMNAWFADPAAPPNLLITADAGRGKTALLVRWLEQLDTEVHKIFLPISIRYETNRPAFFYQALAARLADIAGETLTTSATDAGAHYRERVIEYCDLLESRNVKCLLVIDGLDEANGWSFSESVLGDISTETMRIVAAARLMVGDADAQGWLRRLGWSHRGAGAASILIPPLDSDEIADVLRRTTPRFETLSTNPEVLSTLKRLTVGDPLLLTYYVEDLDDLNVTDPARVLEHLRGKSEGFGAFFDDWLLKQGGLVSEHGTAIEDQAIKKILAILASALGPLLMRDLEALVARAFGNDTLISRDTLQPLNRFIIGDGHQNGFALCHPKLRDFLRQDYFGGSNIVTSADQAFLDWGHDTIAAVRDDGHDPDDASRYLRRHFAQHLNEADVGLERYFDLIDLGWRKAWEADQEGDGLRGFKNDAEAAFDAFQAAYLAGEGHKDLALVGMISAALTVSVVNSLSDNIPDDLIAEALKHKCIALGQALMFAQRSDKMRTMTSMGMLLDTVPEERRTYIFDSALETLRAATKEGEVQHGVASVAPFADEDQQMDLLDLATALKNEWRLAGSIRGLAPYAVPQSIRIMIDEISGIRDAWPRASALLALSASVTAPDDIEAIVEGLRRMSDAEIRTKIATNLAERSTGDLRDALIDDAVHWSASISKVDVFAEVFGKIVEMRPEALDDAVLARLTFPDGGDADGYRNMFRCLGKYFDDDFLHASLVRLLAPSQAWIEEFDDTDSMTDVTFWIVGTGDLLANTAGSVREADNPIWPRVAEMLPTCLDGIVAQFPPDFDDGLTDAVQEALHRIQSQFPRYAWSEHGTEMDVAPDASASGAVAQTSVPPTGHHTGAAYSTGMLVPSPRHATSSEELQALMQGDTTPGMAPHSIDRCLQLLPDVPNDLAIKAIDAAFVAALAPTDSGDIVVCCRDLAASLSPDSIARCLQLALATSDEYDKGQALGALVPYLSEEQRRQVRDAAEGMQDFGSRMFLQCLLAQRDPADQQRALHIEFMDQIADRYDRLGIENGADLTTLKRFMAPDVLQIAQSRFDQKDDEHQNRSRTTRANADPQNLKQLFERMKRGHMSGRELEDYRALLDDPNSAAHGELLEAVRACPQPLLVAKWLVVIAGWLEGAQRNALIYETLKMLETVRNSSDARHSKVFFTVSIVERIAIYLSRDQLLETFDATSAYIKDDIRLLEVFLPHLAMQLEGFDFGDGDSWRGDRRVIAMLFGPVDLARKLADSDDPVTDLLWRETAIFRHRPKLFSEAKGLELIRLFVPYLREEFMGTIWNYVRFMPTATLRADAAIEVALARSEPLRQSALHLALETLQECPPSEWQGLVERIAPLIGVTEAEQALRIAKSLPDPEAREAALVSIWDVMPQHLRPQALVARLLAVSLLPRRVSFPICTRLAGELGDLGCPEATPDLAERITAVLAWWRQ
ncbi:hypothetical protein [uncultured Tateyamaria sp.]|uniref:hypothetical protein n=1 Tax=uncultured Tateyamaria sp. TaxID=455651 RepID=UPI0026309F0C|nr:hypothetical protein [uncultured Tateyamaria sp.]